MSTLTRREIREVLIKLLYIRDFHDAEEIEEQNLLFFEVFSPETSDVDKAYVLSRYCEIINKLGEIDHVIAEAMSGWSMSRVSKVELDILRVAVYEIRFDEEVPDKVAIDEAVEIAKQYGSKDSSYSFVNGVLAKII